MPNYTCERCELKQCRVTCIQCNKHVCENCRLRNVAQYTCVPCYNRRFVPYRESIITIRRDDRIWGQILQRFFDALAAPSGLTLASATIKQYAKSEQTADHTAVRDTYTCIGKQHFLVRSITHNLRTRRFEKIMKISDKFKEELAEKSMHPNRLQYWMNNGWEEYWDYYF